MNKKNKVILIILIIFSLSLLVGSVSSANYNLLVNDEEYEYNNHDYSYNVYFNAFCGYVSTNGYNQINYIKLTDINGEKTTLKKNINFKNVKKNDGYYASIEFDSEKLKLNNLKSVEINLIKQPDLAITKIKKINKGYYVTIKNNGDVLAKTSKLGIYYGSKKITTINTPYISPKNKKTIKVKIPKKYQSKKYKYTKKTFKANYNNKINEIKSYNNKKIIYN